MATCVMALITAVGAGLALADHDWLLAGYSAGLCVAFVGLLGLMVVTALRSGQRP